MESNCIVDTIMFDMGGVIFENGTKNIIRKLVNYFDIDVDIAENIFNGPDSWMLRAGKISSDEYWNEIYQKYNELSLLKNLNLQVMWYNEFRLREGMKELIIELKYKYRVGVLSGNIPERVDFLLNKYDLRNIFNFQAYSFHYGLQKNDSKLYERVIFDHEMEPKSTVLIDDNSDCLQTASEFGLKTILFSDLNNLYSELGNYGLR